MRDNTWSTLFYIIVMVAVLFAAYFTTKYLSGKARRIVKSRHIVVLDRMGIAKDKMLMVVKVGDKSMLIGVTNQSISSLGEVDVGEAPAAEEEPKSTQGALSKFAEILSNARKAPEELAKARREQRQRKSKSSEPPDAVENDYIDQITRAIERRKNAKTHDNEGPNE